MADRAAESEADSSSPRRERRKRRSTSEPRFHRIFDQWTGGCILALVIMTPWLFGTNDQWAMDLMNILGFVLGGLMLGKWGVRRFSQYEHPRWDAGKRGETPGQKWLRRACGLLTILLLVQCLVAALNPRATFDQDNNHFEYHSYISWLPFTYDRVWSWDYFRTYLALAFFFWAAREWLLGKTESEIARQAESGGRTLPLVTLPGERGAKESVNKSGPTLPERLRVLLWVLCVNGTLVGLEGIAQRLDGTNAILWIQVPIVNKYAASHFGPYPYRGNAAQFFNLIWPICLGFWWTLWQERKRQGGVRATPGPELLLVPSAVIMAICPILSYSRGGVLVEAILVPGAFIIFFFANRRAAPRVRLFILLVFLTFGVTAAYFGYDKLKERFKEGSLSEMSGRHEIYQNAARMAEDYPVFGTGPGSFLALYQFYREEHDQRWQTSVHDDYLETRITFGWVGYVMILLLLGLVLIRWFMGGGIPLPWELAAFLWLSAGGCLLHAKFDFPMQVYSVLLVFLTVCGLLFVGGRDSGRLRG